jgi:hypothetical protein
MSYKVFKDFSLALGMLLATANAIEFARNCLNLPKDKLA